MNRPYLALWSRSSDIPAGNPEEIANGQANRAWTVSARPCRDNTPLATDKEACAPNLQRPYLVLGNQTKQAFAEFCSIESAS